MTETDTQVDNFRKEDYFDILQHTFSDIVRLSDGDRDLFEELYYNRDQEFNDFSNEAKKLFTNGNNMLVIGDAGSGKTNFIYRLFYDSEFMEKANLFPMLFDYRDIVPNSLEGFKMRFIKNFDKFFKSIEYDINLKSNDKANIDDNLFIIQTEFNDIPADKLIKHPILFIDDLDYAEDDLFDLLDFLSPYARNKKNHILLSVRPPLLYKIRKNNDFKYSFLFTNNVREIKLRQLNVHNVLSTRLAPIIMFKPEYSFFKAVLQKIGILKNPDSKYIKLLKKLGIENLEQLKEFSYPFTDDYANFMARITNCNYREIFTIAIESLYYILENYNTLAILEKDGCSRRIIPEDKAVEIFTKEESRYKLFNVHKLKNEQGNSLYYNVLEALQSFRNTTNLSFYQCLQKYGHDKEIVNKALKELSKKENRLVLDLNCAFDTDLREYEIEDKGKYYLSDIVKWKGYIEKFGTSNQSIIETIVWK